MISGEFIILGSTKLKENALVLHTISPEWGRRSFIVNVSRKTSGALYQILSIIDAEVIPNPRSELYRLRSVGTAYPLTSLRTDMRKSAITMFLGEVLYRTLTEGMVDGGLFDWCKTSILTLEELRGDFSNFHLWFLKELISRLGFRADRDTLMPFASESLEALCRIISSDFASCMMIPLNGAVRSELASTLIRYLSFHCNRQMEICSLSVLQALEVWLAARLRGKCRFPRKAQRPQAELLLSAEVSAFEGSGAHYGRL